ncbi:MAG: hypothetical protein ACFB20_13455 [Opitutales bacterium]
MKSLESSPPTSAAATAKARGTFIGLLAALLAALLHTGCGQRIDETVAGTWRIDTEATFETIAEVEAWKKLSTDEQAELRTDIEAKTNVFLTFAPELMTLRWEGEQIGGTHELTYTLEHLQKDSFRARHPVRTEQSFSMTLKLLDDDTRQLRVLSERFEPWMRYVVWRRVTE